MNFQQEIIMAKEQNLAKLLLNTEKRLNVVANQTARLYREGASFARNKDVSETRIMQDSVNLLKAQGALGEAMAFLSAAHADLFTLAGALDIDVKPLGPGDKGQPI